MLRLLFLPLLLLGCTKISDANDVDSNYDKWKKLGISDYQFTLRVNCFCPIETVGPHQVVVKNNAVVSVNGSSYDPNQHYHIKTINQFFDFIQKTLAQKPAQKTLEFDPKYHVPLSIFFDLSEMIADEEIGYVITDFKPL